MNLEEEEEEFGRQLERQPSSLLIPRPYGGRCCACRCKAATIMARGSYAIFFVLVVLEYAVPKYDEYPSTRKNVPATVRRAGPVFAPADITSAGTKTMRNKKNETAKYRMDKKKKKACEEAKNTRTTRSSSRYHEEEAKNHLLHSRRHIRFYNSSQNGESKSG